MLQNVKLDIQIENVTHMGLLISQQVVSSDIQGLLGPQPRRRGSHSTKVSVYSNKSRIRYDYYTSCESAKQRGGHLAVFVICQLLLLAKHSSKSVNGQHQTSKLVKISVIGHCISAVCRHFIGMEKLNKFSMECNQI